MRTLIFSEMAYSDAPSPAPRILCPLEILASSLPTWVMFLLSSPKVIIDAVLFRTVIAISSSLFLCEKIGSHVY